MASKKVAIVHYWLVGMRGGERVLEAICRLYPDADIFTHVVDRERLSAALRSRNIHTTFISKLPFARRHYQKYLPLMPRALEMLDLSDYDLVISCEAGPAKGVITRPDAVHVTYCHSPMRYIWDQYHQYQSAGGLGARLTMPLFASSLRMWDVTSAARTDAIMANSAFVQSRIAKFWRRKSVVVHPPVETGLFAPSAEITDEYLWVGQLVPYKRPDVAVDTFTQMGKKLHVIGDGSMSKELRRRAGPTIRFTEHADFASLRHAYARTKALIFTAEEDFGIIPVEVMASGRPVLAYRRGGALETVVEGETGLFYDGKGTTDLADGVKRLEEWLPRFSPSAAVAHAQSFSPEVFQAKFSTFVDRAFERDPDLIL